MIKQFKKYRKTRKNVLLLAQAIINVEGKIDWKDYVNDDTYADKHSIILDEIKSVPAKFELFKKEFAYKMFSDEINKEMQELELA